MKLEKIPATLPSSNVQVTHREIDYPDGDIFVTKTDTQGVITYANDSFIEVSGYSREELIGKNHNIVRHSDMPRWAFADLWTTIQLGHPWRGIVKNCAKNGDHYWVRATVSPIVSDNKVVGYISLRRKPSKVEVAQAQNIYRLEQPPLKSSSLIAWFSMLQLKTKLQLSVQLVMLTILTMISVVIADLLKTEMLDATYQQLITRLAIGVVLAQTLLFFVIGWIIRRFVSKPIEEINTSLNHLINGDVRGQVDISGRDEMGKVLCAVQTSKIYLGSSFDRIATASKKLYQANKLSESVAKISAASHTQSEASASMAAAVEQMTVTIDQITETSSEVQRISEQSKAAADNGEDTVRQVVDKMNRINFAVADVAKKIDALGAKSEQIKIIVKTIHEISDQTNLLALNAAIEAACAGEAGRGFSVVADAVRKLAEKTRNATQGIATVVNDINAGTADAVTEMIFTVEMVKAGSELVEKTGVAMAEISVGAYRVLNGVEDVLAALREQSAASREIAVNVERVAQMSEKNNVALRGVSVTAECIKEQVLELDRSIEHFKV